jgi:hypothetical protein
MSICPNKNLPEWKALVAEVGNFEAFRDFMETNGDIRSPQVVSSKIKARTSDLVLQLTRTTAEGQPVNSEILQTLLSNLQLKFGAEYGYRIDYDLPGDTPWKGKVEAGNQTNGGKPTVVINAKKATLDTPLHEFGHIFLNLIKSGNIALYSKLIEKVEKNPAYSKELDAVKHYYRGKGMTDVEMKEEAIVELMGRFAADQIDPKTGLYKALESIWEAIKDIFKDMMGITGTTDVLRIKPDASIETLSHMLANKDVLVSAGGETAVKKKKNIDNLQTRLDKEQEELNKLEKLGADNPEGINVVTGPLKTYVVEATVAEKIAKVLEELPTMRDYLAGFYAQKESLEKDTSEIYNAFYLQAAEAVDNEDSYAVADKIWNKFMAADVYKKFKFFIRNDEFAEKQFKRQIRAFHNGEMSKTIALGEFEDYVDRIRDAFLYGDEKDFAAQIMGQHNATLTRIFGDTYKALATFSGKYTSFERVLDGAQGNIDETQGRIDQMKKGSRASGATSFTIEVVGPDGQTETDKITVTTSVRENGTQVYVAFESGNWMYKDPLWARPYTADMKVTLAKTSAQKEREEFLRRREAAGLNDTKESRELKRLERHTPSQFRIKGRNKFAARQGDIMKIEGDHAFVQFAHGGGHAMYPPVHNGLSKIPLVSIEIISEQNRSKVMPQVIDAISELHYDLNYNAITFSSAGGQSNKRAVGEMRDMLYTRNAEKIFGSNFAGVEHRGMDSTIFIPDGFRDGLLIEKELYQVDRGVKSEIPFGSEREDSLMGQAVSQITTELVVDEVNDQKVEAIEMANKMSQMLGIEYEMISAKDAEVLTKDAKNPWAGESAFFVGGKVYFVGDNINSNMVFHEFAHPFVRAISVENKELFNNLYNQLRETPEGQELISLVQATYSELDPESDLFKEEVLVRAIEKAGVDEAAEAVQPTGFKNFIKEIMYAIKQMMRRVFGKTSAVSKLTPSTTIRDLADMLNKGGKIEIDRSTVSQADVVAYVREQEDYIKDLMNIGSSEVQALINRVYDISGKHIETLLNNKEFDELASILTDEHKRGDLQEMKSRVQEYQTMVSNMANETKNDMEDMRKRTTALVDTMFRLETVMNKVLLHMQDIAQDEDTQGNMAKAHYYDQLVKYWEGFIAEANEAIDDPRNGVPNNSPITQLVGNISRTINRVKSLTNDMYANGARDTLYQELEPMGRSIAERYEKMIQLARDKKAPQARIDKFFKEYHGVTEAEYNRMKALQAERLLSPDQQNELAKLEGKAAAGIAISPEKIERLLKGEMGDANFFNSYLEGYLYNTDPIIGGLALYVKNKMNEVMANSQAKFNEFANDMAPLLKKAGYNPSKVGELGEKVGFVDKTSSRDEDGNIMEREVWTLLNPFKNFRYDYDKHKDNVEKAQYKLAQTGDDTDRKALATAIADRQAFMRKYYNQENVAEYYEREELFEKDDIGKEAMFLRKNLFERMRMISEPATTQADYMDISDELDELWREYRQLHSEFYLNGKRKTGNDLEIALRLKDYRDESRKFHEFKLRKGVFENSLLAYEQELNDAGTAPEEFKILRDEWIRRNTRTVVKQEYYERRQEVIDRIAELMAKLPDTERKNLDQSEVWNQIFDLTAGFRDDNGQPDGSAMDKNSVARVKKFQEEMQKIRGNYMQRNGLTAAENSRLGELHTLKGQRALTADEQAEMRDMYDKKSTFGLSKWDIAELDSLYEELSQLSKREATEYYADIVNDWLSKMDTDKLFLATGARSITRLGADKLLEDQALLSNLLAQNEDFAKWFRANHIQKESYNKTTGKTELKWERLYVWSVVRPTDENYLETYDIKDTNGQVTETIKGLPANSYYARVVKPEYRTKRIVGTTVDNKGHWLPKTQAQAGKGWDDRYINKEYFDLEKKDKPLFDVLEKLKEHHLKNQEELGYNSRLYYDFPRFRKDNLETLQTTNIKGAAKGKMNALTIWAQRVRDFFRESSEQDQEGLNYKEKFNLVRADMFDNEVTGVPIAGLYDTELQDVSTDITHSMMRYMLSAERQKQLIKISPLARAVQNVVNDPKNAVKEIDKVNKFNFIHRGVKTYMNKKGASVRQKTVNNFIEREFEGQKMAGATQDVAWLNNTASLLFKRASFGFFALNIPSALKNSYGAKFQGMLEASAGKYMNHVSFQKGNGWAYTTMGELSFGGQLYKRGSRSHRQQMVELFDPSQGRFEEKFGQGLSRTLASDAASMSWLYNFRKWVELQATLQIFGGMMYHQKVMQGDKEISYMDAWETIDGKIRLKEGVDPKWGITYDEEGNMQVGEEFKRYKNQTHQVMNNLQGAYASFDQPEAQRYIAFRFLSYLRRYFTTMTMNRFGFSGRMWDPKPRLNPGLGGVQKGYYVEFLQFSKNMITSLGKNLAYMTPEEKSAALKVITEVGALIAVNMLMALLFGWDPDDDDRYEKLRQRSGALPFPMVGQDDGRDFNGWGFLENHALFLLMNIRAENEQFIPLPGYGLDDYSAMLDLKSIAFGPTVQTYKQLFEDGVDIMQGDEGAYYKRDAGPYVWQKEGSSKFWAHLFRTVGVTGSSVDPAKAIKGFQSVKARAR